MSQEAFDLISSVLKIDDNVELLFAYGSGIKAQKPGEDPSKNMLDYIVAVSDSKRFHQDNIRTNPSHYSILRFLGARKIAQIQRDFAARAYFNTLIKVPQKNRLIKYGVIDTSDLVTDLLDWDSLYISGRLHKPVLIVKNSTPIVENSVRNLTLAMTVNRKSAVHASLLQLPERFSEARFFETLCSLSYQGDFRTFFGEDKRKIQNIAASQLPDLRQLYLPILQDIEQVEISGSSIVQDLSAAAVHNHLELLPKTVLLDIQRTTGRENQDLEEVIFSLAHQHEYSAVISGAIRKIVWRSSVRQSLKNAATAGVCKTLLYSSRKLLKMLKSMR